MAAAGPLPGLVAIGPFCYVREQSPVQYAVRLAEQGFAALAFDCRGHGESEGLPRRFESPTLKTADVGAALDFLATLPEVDPTQLYALGICQGANPVLARAAQDRRIRAVSTVASAFLMGGGGEFVEARIARGIKARADYERDGSVAYLPIVDPLRRDVGLPSRYIYDWYHPWEGRSRWENRYAVMSDAEVWAFDVTPYARELVCPYVMVHSEGAHSPASARALFATIGSSDKSQLWDEAAPDQTKFYSHPATIDRAAQSVATWLKTRG